jgi:hypothetical protein
MPLVSGVTRKALVMAAMIAVLVTERAEGQRFGGGRFGGACNFSWDDDDYFVSPFFSGNPPYDGRVTFARIKYKGSYECGREGPGWSHDYPRTESHFMRIMTEITSMRPFIETGPIIGSKILRLDDP